MLDQANRQKLIEQLKRHEGRVVATDGRHYTYSCPAGFVTIGYGHNLSANPLPGVDLQAGLSEDQAERLLSADLAVVEQEVFDEWAWAGLLNQPRQAVLLNMGFNLGLARLQGFGNTLNSIARGNYADAAYRMGVSKWAKQVGKRARELADQMVEGAWQF